MAYFRTNKLSGIAILAVTSSTMSIIIAILSSVLRLEAAYYYRTLVIKYEISFSDVNTHNISI